MTALFHIAFIPGIGEQFLQTTLTIPKKISLWSLEDGQRLACLSWPKDISAFALSQGRMPFSPLLTILVLYILLKLALGKYFFSIGAKICLADSCTSLQIMPHLHVVIFVSHFRTLYCVSIVGCLLINLSTRSVCSENRTSFLH